MHSKEKKYTDVQACFSYPLLLKQDTKKSQQFRVQLGARKSGLSISLLAFVDWVTWSVTYPL
jgi:hypothetical protein